MATTSLIPIKPPVEEANNDNEIFKDFTSVINLYPYTKRYINKTDQENNKKFDTIRRRISDFQLVTKENIQNTPLAQFITDRFGSECNPMEVLLLALYYHSDLIDTYLGDKNQYINDPVKCIAILNAYMEAELLVEQLEFSAFSSQKDINLLTKRIFAHALNFPGYTQALYTRKGKPTLTEVGKILDKLDKFNTPEIKSIINLHPHLRDSLNNVEDYKKIVELKKKLFGEGEGAQQLIQSINKDAEKSSPINRPLVDVVLRIALLYGNGILDAVNNKIPLDYNTCVKIVAAFDILKNNKKLKTADEETKQNIFYIAYTDPKELNAAFSYGYKKARERIERKAELAENNPNLKNFKFSGNEKDKEIAGLNARVSALGLKYPDIKEKITSKKELEKVEKANRVIEEEIKNGLLLNDLDKKLLLLSEIEAPGASDRELALLGFNADDPNRLAILNIYFKYKPIINQYRTAAKPKITYDNLKNASDAAESFVKNKDESRKKVIFELLLNYPTLKSLLKTDADFNKAHAFFKKIYSEIPYIDLRSSEKISRQNDASLMVINHYKSDTLNLINRLIETEKKSESMPLIKGLIDRLAKFIVEADKLDLPKFPILVGQVITFVDINSSNSDDLLQKIYFIESLLKVLATDLLPADKKEAILELVAKRSQLKLTGKEDALALYDAMEKLGEWTYFTKRPASSVSVVKTKIIAKDKIYDGVNYLDKPKSGYDPGQILIAHSIHRQPIYHFLAKQNDFETKYKPLLIYYFYQYADGMKNLLAHAKINSEEDALKFIAKMIDAGSLIHQALSKNGKQLGHYDDEHKNFMFKVAFLFPWMLDATNFNEENLDVKLLRLSFNETCTLLGIKKSEDVFGYIEILNRDDVKSLFIADYKAKINNKNTGNYFDAVSRELHLDRNDPEIANVRMQLIVVYQRYPDVIRRYISNYIVHAQAMNKDNFQIPAIRYSIILFADTAVKNLSKRCSFTSEEKQKAMEWALKYPHVLDSVKSVNDLHALDSDDIKEIHSNQLLSVYSKTVLIQYYLSKDNDWAEVSDELTRITIAMEDAIRSKNEILALPKEEENLALEGRVLRLDTTIAQENQALKDLINTCTAHLYPDKSLNYDVSIKANQGLFRTGIPMAIQDPVSKAITHHLIPGKELYQEPAPAPTEENEWQNSFTRDSKLEFTIQAASQAPVNVSVQLRNGADYYDSSKNIHFKNEDITNNNDQGMVESMAKQVATILEGDDTHFGKYVNRCRAHALMYSPPVVLVAISTFPHTYLNGIILDTDKSKKITTMVDEHGDFSVTTTVAINGLQYSYTDENGLPVEYTDEQYAGTITATASLKEATASAGDYHYMTDKINCSGSEKFVVYTGVLLHAPLLLENAIKNYNQFNHINNRTNISNYMISHKDIKGPFEYIETKSTFWANTYYKMPALGDKKKFDTVIDLFKEADDIFKLFFSGKFDETNKSYMGSDKFSCIVKNLQTMYNRETGLYSLFSIDKLPILASALGVDYNYNEGLVAANPLYLILENYNANAAKSPFQEAVFKAIKEYVSGDCTALAFYQKIVAAENLFSHNPKEKAALIALYKKNPYTKHFTSEKIQEICDLLGLKYTGQSINEVLSAGHSENVRFTDAQQNFYKNLSGYLYGHILEKDYVKHYGEYKKAISGYQADIIDHTAVDFIATCLGIEAGQQSLVTILHQFEQKRKDGKTTLEQDHFKTALDACLLKIGNSNKTTAPTRNEQIFALSKALKAQMPKVYYPSVKQEEKSAHITELGQLDYFSTENVIILTALMGCSGVTQPEQGIDPLINYFGKNLLASATPLQMQLNTLVTHLLDQKISELDFVIGVYDLTNRSMQAPEYSQLRELSNNLFDVYAKHTGVWVNWRYAVSVVYDAWNSFKNLFTPSPNPVGAPKEVQDLQNAMNSLPKEIAIKTTAPQTSADIANHLFVESYAKSLRTAEAESKKDIQKRTAFHLNHKT